MKKTALLFSFLFVVHFSFSQESQTDDFSDYGGEFSYGIAIGGSGLVGVPFRIHIKETVAIELGAYFEPVFLFDEFTEEVNSSSAIAISAGVNFFMDYRVKEHKFKYSRRGLFLKGDSSFGEFNSSFIGVGWTWENFLFNRKHRSFILDLGIGPVFNHWVGDPQYAQYRTEEVHS